MLSSTPSRFCFLPLLLLTSSFHSSSQQALECCGMKMLDSQNNVAIEVGRSLGPGRYRALVFKACNTETLQVQVWTNVSPGNYVLKWSTTINPTLSQTTEKRVIVSFSSPLDITSQDRIALYSPGNSHNKISVPYSYSSTSSIRLSSKSFDFPFNLPLGETTSLKSTVWPRTFENTLKLCRTAANCPALGYENSTSPEKAFSKYISMPATCCDPERLPSCDLTNRTMVILNEQTNVINVLIDRITYLKQLISNYVKGVNELGYCEDPTYTKGLYGLGHCYKVFKQSVELAEAAILCSADKARIVFIKDQFEDNFVRIMLQKAYLSSAVSVKSWIAAMYGIEQNEKNWYWYNNLLPGDNFESFGIYVKWKNGQTPRPVSNKDVCASYSLDLRTNTYFWEKEKCTSKHPFICKIKKLCY